MPLHDLSLTIDLVLRSIKERLKGNVVLHIHILLAPVHSTLPPRLSLQRTQTIQNYVLRRQKS